MNHAAPSVDTVERIRLVLDLDPSSNFIEYEGQWMVRSTARRIVDRIREEAVDLDLQPGTEVGVVARNRPAVVAAMLALFLDGHCVVPLSPMQRSDRLAEEIRRLDVAAVVGSDEDWGELGLRQTCEELGVSGLSVSPTEPFVKQTTSAARPGRRGSRREGVAVLMMTSGTTGPPKRIEITYADLDSGFGRASRYSRSSTTSMTTVSIRSGVALVSVPITHVGGLWNTLSAILEGRPLALMDRFEPHAWSSLVERHRIAVTAIPPTALRMIVDAGIPKERLSTLRAITSGTAPLDPALEEEFMDRYGVPILTTYGATEFPGGVAGWTLELKREFGPSKRGSVGRPRPGVAVRVVDPNADQVLAAGEEGTLEIRTAQTVGRPNAVDGWVRCTDLGKMDDDGFLWITGRSDDAIIRGGFKVVPQVVESAMEKHPAVRHAAVIGTSDRRLGAVPVAVVELAEPVSIDELMMWMRTELLAYQIPTEVYIVPEIPRTASMKPSKPDIRALIESARRTPSKPANPADSNG